MALQGIRTGSGLLDGGIQPAAVSHWDQMAGQDAAPAAQRGRTVVTHPGPARFHAPVAEAVAQ